MGPNQLKEGRGIPLHHKVGNFKPAIETAKNLVRFLKTKSGGSEFS